MAAKKTSKTPKQPAPATKLARRTEPTIPEALNTPEFGAAWSDWQRFTTERGIELTPEDAARQLQLLAKLGPDKAIADIHKTMENHPLRDRVPGAKAARPKPTSAKTKKAAKAQPDKANPEKKTAPKKMSALDAAAKVLAETGQSMNCQELVQAMSDKAYWVSPGGLTPASTLYAALLREIGKKGTAARFRKAERGKFQLNAK